MSVLQCAYVVCVRWQTTSYMQLETHTDARAHTHTYARTQTHSRALTYTRTVPPLPIQHRWCSLQDSPAATASRPPSDAGSAIAQAPPQSPGQGATAALWPRERMCHTFTPLRRGAVLLLGVRSRDGVCEDAWWFEPVSLGSLLQVALIYARAKCWSICGFRCPVHETALWQAALWQAATGRCAAHSFWRA